MDSQILKIKIESFLKDSITYLENHPFVKEIKSKNPDEIQEIFFDLFEIYGPEIDEHLQFVQSFLDDLFGTDISGLFNFNQN